MLLLHMMGCIVLTMEIFLSRRSLATKKLCKPSAAVQWTPADDDTQLRPETQVTGRWHLHVSNHTEHTDIVNVTGQACTR